MVKNPEPACALACHALVDSHSIQDADHQISLHTRTGCNESEENRPCTYDARHLAVHGLKTSLSLSACRRTFNLSITEDVGSYAVARGRKKAAPEMTGQPGPKSIGLFFTSYRRLQARYGTAWWESFGGALRQKRPIFMQKEPYQSCLGQLCLPQSFLGQLFALGINLMLLSPVLYF